MSILFWILFGLIVGLITNFIAPSSAGGIIGSIILGIIGAIVGGWLGQKFFGVGVTGFNLMSFVVAVAGALLIILIGRLLMRGNS